MSIYSNSRKIALFALYLTYFSDLLAWSVVLMIFAPLLVAKTSPLLSPTMLLAKRNLILGGLTAIYPLAQFFAAPILGELSDCFGRKKVLIFSTFGSFVSFALSAVAILIANIPLLFMSRLLAGLSAGNMTLSQAGVADLTDEKVRGRYMAFFAMVSGLGWILGPYIGSALSNSQMISWFNFSTPFWAIAILFLICFTLITLWFKETYVATSKDKLMLKHAFASLISIFEVRAVIWPFIVFALTYLGYFLFMAFFSADLIEKYGFSLSQIGNIFIYASVWFFVGGILSNQWLLKKYSPASINVIFLFILAIAIFISAFLPKAVYFWVLLIFISISCSIVTSCLFTINSTLVPASMQGRIFGSINAMFALCFAITPPAASWLADQWIGLPDLVGGIILILSAIIFTVWYLRSNRV